MPSRPVTQTPRARDKAQGYLDQMTDSELLCRGNHRHRFGMDEMMPGAKKLPKGTYVSRHQGVYTIEDECERGCGRVRVYTSGSGQFELDSKYRYYDTEGHDHVVIPNDSGVTLTARDFKAAYHTRSGVSSLVKAAAVNE